MEEKSTEIEVRILEAAGKVFTSKGYDSTNMSMIAEAAGISRPSLYYYYRTKDKIFKAIFSSAISAVLPKIREALEEDLPLKDRISNIISIYLDAYLLHPDIVRFISEEINRDCDHLIDTIFDLKYGEELNKMIVVINKEIKEGNIREVPLYSLFFTFIGAIAIPFLTKNAVERVFCKPSEGSAKLWMDADNFEDLVLKWKPFAVRQVCLLLLTDYKDNLSDN